MAQMNSTNMDHARAMHSMVEAAAKYHSQGNVVLRNQMLISIESSPVASAVKRKALTDSGLLPYYQG